MKTIDKYLTMLVRGVIGVALIVLFVVAFSVIIGRIFFDASMGWSQDVIRLCFTYGTSDLNRTTIQVRDMV